MPDDTFPRPTEEPSPRRRTRPIASAVAIGVAGAAAGGVLAATMSANAAGSDTGASTYGESGAPAGGHDNGNTDPTKPMRDVETLLTGTTKAKVLAVVKAKYPKATIQRVETDSDGIYEAHIVNNGTDTIVQVGKAFTITGTQTGGGVHGGGDHDGDGPGAPPAA
jgi:hypothetical protein